MDLPSKLTPVLKFTNECTWTALQPVKVPKTKEQIPAFLSHVHKNWWKFASKNEIIYSYANKDVYNYNFYLAYADLANSYWEMVYDVT